ncbi:MAG: hypothetical protein LBR48_08030 [Dysgonamonadaceae bacterium]|jgi:uncharacterized membrane protein|nr:hypothetical protein [Dysgonamonadaceae bacterium]
MAWYVIVLIASAALFVLTTVGSLIFGDLETGVDVSADIDPGALTTSDLISFKGLLHFALGFSLVLTLTNDVTWVSCTIAVLTGLVFVVVLYYLYNFVYTKLQQNLKYTEVINEMDAEVYFWNEDRKIGEVFITLEGRPVTVTLLNADGLKLEKGQKIKVSGTRKSVHPVEFIV